MKKRINLFVQKKRSSVYPIVSDRVNFYSTLVGMLLFVVMLVFVYLQVQIQTRKNELNREKQEIYDIILANRDEIAKMSLYSHKNSQLKTFLKDDAEFLPYYNLLKDAIVPENTQSNAILDFMEIDKNKKTLFTVRFLEYPPAYDFLKIMESSEFLDNFIELKLVGFNLNDTNTTVADKRGYELQFEGKFKPISGTTIQ